jgi:hypothetical protein
VVIDKQQPTPTDNVIQPRVVLKKELPPPVLKVKPKAIPVTIAPEGVIQKQPEPPLSPKKTMPAIIKATQIRNQVLTNTRMINA